MLDSKYWVWFQIMFGFGTFRSHSLLNQYNSPKELYDLLYYNNLPKDFLNQLEQSAFEKSMDKAEHIVAVTYKKSCSIITPDHQDYPPLLQHIYGKPAALYVKGDLSCLKSGRTFTLVGARKNSKYGEKAAISISENLSQNKCNIVSGLAVGIDSICLETALDNGSKAVGVLACGLDYDYPKNSAKLKRKMVENGAVISEYPMGTIPRPYMFIPRNRIMSGMSDGVVVIEAGDRSGALITAQLAFDNNREVFVVPGEMFAGTFTGSHKLIKDGIGRLINNAGEILSEFPKYKNLHEEGKSKANIKSVEVPKLAKEKQRPSLPEGMDDIIYKIYEAVDESYQTADQISEKIDENISDVLGSVTILELLGLINSRPGGFFTLS